MCARSLLIPLMTPSVVIYIFGVGSRSRRINQSQCSGLEIGWFFRLCFWLWKSSSQWIRSDEVVNGNKRNRNVLILPTPMPSSLWLRWWLRFSPGHRSTLNDSDKDYDSVASANQPLSSSMSHFYFASLFWSHTWGMRHEASVARYRCSQSPRVLPKLWGENSTHVLQVELTFNCRL